MSSLAILGVSGHGSVVADVAMSTKVWKTVLFDDAYPTKNQRIIGNSLDLENNNNFDELLIAIGNSQVRLERHIYFVERGDPMETLFHPSATISSTAKIGAGAVVINNLPDEITAIGIPARAMNS